MTIPPRTDKKRENIHYRCTKEHKDKLDACVAYYGQDQTGLLTTLVEREYKKVARTLESNDES